MKLKHFLEKIKQENRRALTERESRFVLSSYGIKFAKGDVASSAENALEIAERIGYPVALKIVSKDILHKTDVGGVALNIKTPEQLKQEYDKIIANVKSKVPHASIGGIFVQQMITEGFELILGAKKDPTFGPVIMIGWGGIYVEALDDIAFRIAPITKKDAFSMLEETKIGKLLKGFRGRSANINAVADSAAKLSTLIMQNPEISEIDINPLLVEKEAIALDARILL